MAAIAGTLAFAGCTDDVYDPERGIQTEPKENPLGEDFAAPDGFNWSMINTVNLNVEVNDEFDGRYKYLIEVFTANPISDVSAAPIAVGTADKDGNYSARKSTNTTFPKTAEHWSVSYTAFQPVQKQERQAELQPIPIRQPKQPGQPE